MPEVSSQDYGPLAGLIGTWEGVKGDDIAPADDRTQTENNKYREKVVFEPIGMVNNHEQTLFGLRYSTVAWRLNEPDPFHEEVGYWLWDAKAKQVMKTFIVPRGVTVIAGGSAEATAKSFKISSEVGSQTYGICSNLFLDKEFKTVRYELSVELKSPNQFFYRSDTQLKIKGQEKIFHHTDENLMTKVK